MIAYRLPHLRPAARFVLTSVSAWIALALGAAGQQLQFRELHRMLPAPEGTATGTLFLSGDFDGNGSTDLIALPRIVPGSTTPLLYLNDGTGYFRERPGSFSTTVTVALASGAVADIDADGDMDALLISNGQPRLFANDGFGTFSEITASVLPPRVEIAGAAAFGDLDGDGDLDLVMGTRYASQSSSAPGRSLIYRQDDGGRFTLLPTSQFDPPTGAAVQVLLVDLDGDGDLDIFMADERQNRLYVNDLNGPTGAIRSSTAFPAPLESALSAEAGDLDGDGDLDLLVANSFGTPFVPYRLLQNQGNASFVEIPGAIAPPPSNSDPQAIALLDLDRDGDLDLYLSERQGDRALRNAGGWLFQVDSTLGPIPPPLSGSIAITSGDFDSDGDKDVILSDSFHPASSLYLNDGRGALHEVTLPGFGLRRFQGTELVAGDVDGDDFPDLLVGRYNPTQIELYRNDGTGSFDSGIPFAWMPLFWFISDLVLEDIDRDGDLDLLAVISGDSSSPLARPWLFLNDGSGGFTDVTISHLPQDVFLGARAAFGDLDLDGDLDLVISAFPDSRGQNGRNRLYWNDGAGVFSNGTSAGFPGENLMTSDVALADLDGDGDLDVVLANQGRIANGVFVPMPDSIYLNRGNRTFVAANNLLSVNSEHSTAVGVGDFDGDGDIDVVIGTMRAGSFAYLNDGRGRLTRAPFGTFLPPIFGEATQDIVVTDWDGDGRSDIAFINNDAPHRMLRGVAGSPAFQELPATTWPQLYGRPSGFTRLASADMDLDGDLDALSVAYDRILTNLSRQLSWRARPRIGRPLQLDLHGEGGAPFALFVSTSRVAIELPPLGTLRLDPRAIELAAVGNLDVGGRSTVGFSIPNDPLLLGRSLYWQAILGSNPALTNLERTSFSAR